MDNLEKTCSQCGTKAIYFCPSCGRAYCDVCAEIESGKGQCKDCGDSLDEYITRGFNIK